MSQALVIRSQNFADQADYHALAALYKYAYPEEQSTAMALKLTDNARSAEHVCERFFAEQNGVIKGVGVFEHWADYFHPDKYLLHLIVAPEFQNQGVGSALYRHTTEQLEKQQPQFVRAWVQKDREQSVAFAENRGFTQIKLKWNIRLDLASWNIKPFAEQAVSVHDDGIEIKALSQMNNDAEHQRKLYELYVMTINSIEGADDAAIPSFEEFIARINQSSDELTFIAIHNNLYVGMWQLENESVNSLFGGIMAVDKAYRQRGVGFALAVHGIARSKFFQYKTLTVHTDEHNKAILTLTEKMGFTHLPAQIFFSKEFAK
ncbi:MAG: GNAT family N-acetyltransferase [Pyrinomonadaceae bacterium]